MDAGFVEARLAFVVLGFEQPFLQEESERVMRLRASRCARDRIDERFRPFPLRCDERLCGATADAVECQAVAVPCSLTFTI